MTHVVQTKSFLTLRSLVLSPFCRFLVGVVLSFLLLTSFCIQDYNPKVFISQCLYMTFWNTGWTKYTKEYCETEVFQAACQEDEVVVVKSARYGRMNLGRCVKKDLGYIGCSEDVLTLADRKCSGRNECRIRMPDPDFDGTKPCLEELKTYLEASYECIKVSTPPTKKCSSSDAVIRDQQSGFIASYTSSLTGCGTTKTPWRIEAPAGQKIELTLFDFGISSTIYRTEQDLFRQNQPVYACKDYGTIEEDYPVNHRKQICGGQVRTEKIHTTTNNSVMVTFSDQVIRQMNSYFILHFEVVGCSDFEVPLGTWFKRDELGATVGCLASDEQWRLICHGNTWVGKVGNCTTYPYQPLDTKGEKGVALPHGATVIIILALAFCTGVIIVGIGLCCIKRKCLGKRRRNNRRNVREEVKFEDEQIKIVQENIKDGKNDRVAALSGNEYSHIWDATLGRHTLKDHRDYSHVQSKGSPCRTLDVISQCQSSPCRTKDIYGTLRSKPCSIPDVGQSRPGMGTMNSKSHSNILTCGSPFCVQTLDRKGGHYSCYLGTAPTTATIRPQEYQMCPISVAPPSVQCADILTVCNACSKDNLDADPNRTLDRQNKSSVSSEESPYELQGGRRLLIEATSIPPPGGQTQIHPPPPPEITGEETVTI